LAQEAEKVIRLLCVQIADCYMSSKKITTFEKVLPMNKMGITSQPSLKRTKLASFN